MAENERRRRKAPRPHRRTILVIGLGRFGGALALTLEQLGHEVLGIDENEAIVQEFSDQLTHVVQADSTSTEALRQLGCKEAVHAVVAIGTDIEASILTTSALVELGVPDIWAKAVTGAHAKILERVGANQVVSPEEEMGVRVAHRVTGQAMDYVEIDENFALVETAAPKELIGKTLSDGDVRAKYKITVVAIKPDGQSFTYATPYSVINEGDVLLVAGEIDEAEGFAYLE